MNIKKSLQSTTKPLERLIKNSENLDFRLDEPKWEGLEVGDCIEYWEDFSGWDKEPSKNSRKVKAQIVQIIRASSFNELMDKCTAINYDEINKQEILKNLRKYWSLEKEKEIGVLGLYVKLVK